jgi:hypothetical protein
MKEARKEGYIYDEEKVQAEICEYLEEFDRDDKIHQEMGDEKVEPKEKEEGNKLVVITKEGEGWGEAVERTLMAKVIMNDLDEGFSD